MYSNKPIVYKSERRKRPDILCRWLEFSSIFVWMILFCVLIFYQHAQPQVETFLDRFFQIKPRETWDYQMLNTAFYFLLFLFAYSGVSLFLNLKRLKRSTDRIRLSFIISLAGSLAGILLYAVYKL